MTYFSKMGSCLFPNVYNKVNLFISLDGAATFLCARRFKSDTPTSAVTKQKILTVAVIGSPNAGKSTLVNCMVNARVSAVSHIAHTTRTFTNGILTQGDTQLIFTDTPGVVSYQEGYRLKMDKSHIRAPKRVAGSADLLGIVVDAASRKTKNYIDENILNIIQEHHSIPSILIMNKIDMLRRKEDLLSLTKVLTQNRMKDEYGFKNYGGSSKFTDCFYTSATTGDGISQLIEYFVSKAKPGPWEYSPNIYCDSSIEQQISEVFRERLLTLFAEEIPWKVKQETLLFDYSQDVVRIHQKLTWPKKSQRRYVLTKIDKLTTDCQKELEIIFNCDVNLSIDISQKDRMIKDSLFYY